MNKCGPDCRGGHLIEPAPGPHRCQTPGSMRPSSQWVRKPCPGMTGTDQPVAMPTLYDIGSLWQCHGCKRWWYCADTPPNPPGGGYRGGGRVWRPVRWWHFAYRKQIKNNPVTDWGGDLIANLMLPAGGRQVVHSRGRR